MLKIKWTDYMTNDKVLKLMQEQKTLIHVIKKRQCSYFGHIMRSQKYSIQQILLMGKLEQKRPRGRKIISWLDNIVEWTGFGFNNLIRNVQDRRKWKEVVSNVL